VWWLQSMRQKRPNTRGYGEEMGRKPMLVEVNVGKDLISR
jgi:hypothetical protein